MRKVFSLLVALMVLISLAVPAFAAETTPESTVDFERTKVTIYPARNKMTDTDLFRNFKGVMPGDTRTQEITLRNLALTYDYINVYMQALPHVDKNNPIVSEDLTQAENFEFLSQLTLTVKDADGDVIYSASPEGEYQLDEAGDLKDPVFLGKMTRANALKTMKLTVELNVPIELNNVYADRLGEVDWVFMYEGHNYPSDNPKTGDYIIMGAVALMAVSAVALVVLLIAKRKKDRK